MTKRQANGYRELEQDIKARKNYSMAMLLKRLLSVTKRQANGYCELKRDIKARKKKLFHGNAIEEAVIGDQKAGKWLLRVGTGHKSYRQMAVESWNRT